MRHRRLLLGRRQLGTDSSNDLSCCLIVRQPTWTLFITVHGIVSRWPKPDTANSIVLRFRFADDGSDFGGSVESLSGPIPEISRSLTLFVEKARESLVTYTRTFLFNWGSWLGTLIGSYKQCSSIISIKNQWSYFTYRFLSSSCCIAISSQMRCVD